MKAKGVRLHGANDLRLVLLVLLVDQVGERLRAVLDPYSAQE